MSTSENITRTVYGAAVQTYLFTSQDFALTPNTTLNEKYNVQSGILPSNSGQPTLQYYAIGNGGHTMTEGTDGVYLPQTIQHQATDAALFKQLPFVLCLPSADLTQAQQAAYAMRTQITVAGTTYIAYYLKRIDYSTTEVEMQLKTVVNGVETTTTFVPTAGNLSPTPADLSTSGVNVTTGNYVTATAKVTITFSEDDITQLQNVANIMYGNPQYAIISEMALVTGVDQGVPATGANSASYTFNEALVAQCATFIETLIPVQFLNSAVSVVVDIGSTDPLGTTTTVSTVGT